MSEGLPEKVPPIPKKGGGKGLTSKVGPLPVWAWGAILVGGIAFVLYIRSKTGNGKTADTTSGADPNALFNAGGGPPAAPANGVPASDAPCPPGYVYIAGACVPFGDSGTPPPDSGGGNPTNDPTIPAVVVSPPWAPPWSAGGTIHPPAPPATPLRVAIPGPQIQRPTMPAAVAHPGGHVAKPPTHPKPALRKAVVAHRPK